MKKMQQGFTLIELMIVVAIIGILAAIAIPQYNDYTAKAQASEAFTLLDGLKTPVVEAVSQLGDAGCVAPVGAVLSGKYVSGITVTGTANACVAEATYGATGNAEISGKKASLTYNASTGAWTCATDLAAKHKPKACT